MESKRGRLDRFLCKALQLSKKQVRALLITEQINVDGKPAKQMDLQIDEFSHIQYKSEDLQKRQPIYLMLNKPIGVVSATKDDEHSTALDLIEHPLKQELHIAGRLDLNSSGLLLLTNDSRWSSYLMSPETKVDKVYQVELNNPVDESYIEGFNKGFYFEFENITTQPAKLEIISEHKVLVTLKEGKYHQIKRMFGRYRNPVKSLHRISIGEFNLQENLAPGEWSCIDQSEISFA